MFSAITTCRSRWGRILIRMIAAKKDSAVITVKTPYMADSITQGVLAKWEVQVESRVKRDQPLASIETDKVNIPVTSPESGIIK